MRVLEVLFGNVAPAIQDLVMPFSGAFELVSWVRITSQHLHGLVRAHLVVPPHTVIPLSILGLVVSPDSDECPEKYELTDPPAGRTVTKPAEYTFF